MTATSKYLTFFVLFILGFLLFVVAGIFATGLHTQRQPIVGSIFALCSMGAFIAGYSLTKGLPGCYAIEGLIRIMLFFLSLNILGPFVPNGGLIFFGEVDVELGERRAFFINQFLFGLTCLIGLILFQRWSSKESAGIQSNRN